MSEDKQIKEDYHKILHNYFEVLEKVENLRNELDDKEKLNKEEIEERKKKLNDLHHKVQINIGYIKKKRKNRKKN